MLSIILGFLGYSLLNVSLATQKIGLLLAQSKRSQGRLLWLLATLGTLASSFLVLAAVVLGSAALVGAMAGAGLASLAVFSHFVMKERIAVREASGVVLIVMAAALIGIFSEHGAALSLRLDRLFWMLALVALLAPAALLAVRRKAGAQGIVIGAFSGTLGGFVPLFQKVSSSDLGQSMSLFPASAGTKGDIVHAVLSMFSNPFTVAWIALSLASMIVLQFAYKKAPVIKIIPFFSAACIIVPVLGGVICLGEQLHPVQWSGVILMLGGLLLLTIKRRTASGEKPAGGEAGPRNEPDT